MSSGDSNRKPQGKVQSLESTSAMGGIYLNARGIRDGDAGVPNALSSLLSTASIFKAVIHGRAFELM